MVSIIFSLSNLRLSLDTTAQLLIHEDRRAWSDSRLQSSADQIPPGSHDYKSIVDEFHYQEKGNTEDS